MNFHMGYSPITNSEDAAEKTQRSIDKLQASTSVVVRTLLFVTLGLGIFISGRLSVTIAECDRKLSTWSPALNAIEYKQHMFDGDFLAPSAWRGRPTEDLEGAWDKITTAGLMPMRMKISDLHRLNKTKSKNTRFLFNNGKEGMPFILEVFHQLHCLNQLRKWTWPKHYNLDSARLEKADRAHLDHCVEMLRIRLMCTSDVTPITTWVPEWQENPTADFSTLHTCRDFDKIREYVEDNIIDYEVVQ